MELERRMVLAAMIAGALPFDPALAKEAPSMTVDAPYAAVAMQLAARSVERAPDRGAARSQILGMIGEVETKIRSARIFIEQYGGHPVKLAVLPEYLFTSYPGRISIPDFAALAADTTPVVCRDDNPEVINAIAYDPGADGDIVRVRICLIYKTINPALGLNVSDTSNGTRRLHGSFLFRNEPFSRNGGVR